MPAGLSVCQRTHRAFKPAGPITGIDCRLWPSEQSPRTVRRMMRRRAFASCSPSEGHQLIASPRVGISPPRRSGFDESIGSPRAPCASPGRSDCPDRQVEDALALLALQVPTQRRLVRAGETVYDAGQRLSHLHVVRCGAFKRLRIDVDGQVQLSALPVRGDWLGLEDISAGRHHCTAVAIDVGEIWSIHYPSLVRACSESAALLSLLLGAMSRELNRDQDLLRSLRMLPAAARVAEFLRKHLESLVGRGMRTDSVRLQLTHAEIGSFLGLSRESVGRALARLAQEGVIALASDGRREMRFERSEDLARFVSRHSAYREAAVQ